MRKLVTRRYRYLVYYTADEAAEEIIIITIQHAARERELLLDEQNRDALRAIDLEGVFAHYVARSSMAEGLAVAEGRWARR